MTIVIFKFRSLKTSRRDYIHILFLTKYISLRKYCHVHVNYKCTIYKQLWTECVCITQFIFILQLVVDRVPKIVFSGTPRNQPKNFFFFWHIRWFFKVVFCLRHASLWKIRSKKLVRVKKIPELITICTADLLGSASANTSFIAVKNLSRVFHRLLVVVWIPTKYFSQNIYLVLNIFKIVCLQSKKIFQ